MPTYPQKLARMRALAGTLLAASMRATLLANTLTPRFHTQGNALGRCRRSSTLTVGFSKNFGAHGNLSSLVSLILFIVHTASMGR